MYSRTSWAATLGLMPTGAQHGRGRFIRPNRASSANMIRRRRPAGLASQHVESRFFKSILGVEVAFGMKRTRHQLAPAVTVEQVINRALTGWMADRLLVSAFEIGNVHHLAGPGGVGKARQQRLFFGERH